jgi:RNA polymerase sigma-70 factor (ECF subfamily)
VDGHDVLAESFEEHRDHLRRVAQRMLGSQSEAEDAVQEAWIRLSRSDVTAVANLRGWLTTVVGRVALDMLRSRQSRREDPLADPFDGAQRTPLSSHGSVRGPEDEAVLAETVGVAMLVVLDTLSPAERVAFVLHDLFGVPFEDIAGALDRSPAAAKQLASRARRRVQGAPAGAGGDPGRSRAIVEAFLSASRNGEFTALLALLHPDVVLRADPAAVRVGAAEALGANAVATTFSGRASAARLALIDGEPGAVWAPGGRPRVAFRFTVDGALVTAIEMVADPERVQRFELEFLEGPEPAPAG